jgi:hypothetical protein
MSVPKILEQVPRRPRIRLASAILPALPLAPARIALTPLQLWRTEPSRCACMRPNGTGTSKHRSISSLWGTWCFGRTLLVVRQVRGRPGADSLRVWPHRKCHCGQEQYGKCPDNRDDWVGNLGPLTNWSAAPPHLLGLSKQVLGIATAAPAVGSKHEAGLRQRAARSRLAIAIRATSPAASRRLICKDNSPHWEEGAERRTHASSPHRPAAPHRELPRPPFSIGNASTKATLHTALARHALVGIHSLPTSAAVLRRSKNRMPSCRLASRIDGRLDRERNWITQ